MIEVESYVILVVGTVVEHHTVFLAVHEREIPVRVPAPLGDVDGVLEELARVEEALYLVLGRNSVLDILETLVYGAWHASGTLLLQTTGKHGAEFVHILALRVGAVVVARCPLDLVRDLVGTQLGPQGNLRLSVGQAGTTTGADLDYAVCRT